MYVRTDEQMKGCMAIHPCVPQDIGPLGPLSKKDITMSTEKAKMLTTRKKKEKVRIPLG